MGKKVKVMSKEEEIDVDVDGVWTIDEVKRECPYHIDEEEPVVSIASRVLVKVLAMTMIHRDTEFLVYLKGDAKERKVEDVYVPEQDVSMGSVHVTEDVEEPGIIGVLHKHPGDGKTNFSHTDCEKLNVNHDISIVIPENGDWRYWRTTVRKRALCGCSKRMDGKAAFLVVTDDIEKASKEKINKKSYDVWSKGKSWDSKFDRYPCLYCDEKYDSYGERERHEKTKHQDKKYEFPWE